MKRISTITACLVCLTGAALAWRALDRGDGEDHTPRPETPTHVERRLERGAGGMVAPTEETVAGLLGQAKAEAFTGASAITSPTPLDASRRQDLADAFEARLAAIVAPDFDAALEDLVERGWPRLSAERRESLRAFWKQSSGAYKLAPFAPDQVEVRPLDPDSLDRDPAPEALGGYQRSSSAMVPPGPDGQPMNELGEVDQGLIETRLPARLSNGAGEPEDVLLAFCFTWDRDLETWRWIATRVYHDPGGAFPAIPPI